MNSSVLEMEDVAVAAAPAPDVVLLEGVNWTVAAGEYWVVAGLPGTGKTSLLLTAAALLHPVRGGHRLFGQDTAAWGEEDGVRERLRVGLVFADEGRLFNQLSVAENLALPICYHRNCPAAEAEEQIQAVLEMTGLSALAHSRPGSIHRTFRPRVALARALVLQPELLLLDDPLRGMDARQTRWWLEFLARLNAGHESLNHRKVALVVVTDDLRPWLDHGQNFALLDEQRWIALGGPAALRAGGPAVLRELLADGMAKD